MSGEMQYPSPQHPRIERELSGDYLFAQAVRAMGLKEPENVGQHSLPDGISDQILLPPLRRPVTVDWSETEWGW